MPESRFQAPGPVRLRVQVPGGSVIVIAVAGMLETVVSVQEHGGPGQRVAVQCRRDGDAFEVSIETAARRWLGFFVERSHVDTHVLVTCPERTDVDINTVAAPVRISGLVGETVVRSVSGDVEVDRAAGRAERVCRQRGHPGRAGQLTRITSGSDWSAS